jgi:hypothetical protein
MDNFSRLCILNNMFLATLLQQLIISCTTAVHWNNSPGRVSVFRLLMVVITARPPRLKKNKIMNIYGVPQGCILGPCIYQKLTFSTSLLFWPAPEPHPRSWDFILLYTWSKRILRIYWIVNTGGNLNYTILIYTG